MEDAGRGLDDAGLAAELAGQLAEALGAELVGAAGEADQDFAGQDQDVAAVGEAFVELEHALEAAAQRRGDLGGLAHPGRGAGLQQDRALGEDEGRVLDEHRIRIIVERRQRLDRESGRARARRHRLRTRPARPHRSAPRRRCAGP